MDVKGLLLCLCSVLLCGHCKTMHALQNLKTGEVPEKRHLLPSHLSEELKPVSFYWESGIIPYVISPDYDDIIIDRIRAAMYTIESVSCVVFKDIAGPPLKGEENPAIWLSIQNPRGVRECSHSTLEEEGASTITKAILIIGYDCMWRRDILHALMHVLGFTDEVTHPQRDMYIRIMWQNIQPKYRPLFWMQTAGTLHKTVEYDSMSIMHFHDRAYSINGGSTIIPAISGLLIAPSDKLSQLDVMKLRLAFGHECNKRKVGNLLQTCQNALQQDDEEKEEEEDEEEEDEAKISTVNLDPRQNKRQTMKWKRTTPFVISLISSETNSGTDNEN